MDYNVIELSEMRQARECQVTLERLCKHIAGVSEAAIRYTKETTDEGAKSLHLRITVLDLFVRQHILKES